MYTVKRGMYITGGEEKISQTHMRTHTDTDLRKTRTGEFQG